MTIDARTILFRNTNHFVAHCLADIDDLFNKQEHEDRKTMVAEMDRFIIDGVLGKEGILFKKDAKLFMKRYTELKQVITIDADKEAAFTNVIETFGLEDFYRKRIDHVEVTSHRSGCASGRHRDGNGAQSDRRCPLQRTLLFGQALLYSYIGGDQTHMLHSAHRTQPVGRTAMVPRKGPPFTEQVRKSVLF